MLWAVFCKRLTIHVGVSLTQTTYINIVADHVQPIIKPIMGVLFLMAVTSFSRIILCHMTQFEEYASCVPLIGAFTVPQQKPLPCICNYCEQGKLMHLKFCILSNMSA